MELVGGLYIVWVLLLVVIAVLWIILPFAIFGTKPRLDNIAMQISINNTLQKEILAELKKLNEVKKEAEKNTVNNS